MRAVTPHGVLVLIVLVAAGAVALAEPPSPCTVDVRSAEFAFWVGDWDVRLGDGRLAGRNSIRYAEMGCRIEEHWSPAGGGGGSSISFLDPADGVWEQIWHSPDGIFFRIRGSLKAPGDMLMTGTVHYLAQGAAAPLRGRWTQLENGGVRQYFEQFDSEAMAWRPWFEGFYTRAEGAASADR
ncbi:MAG: hypothetical protein VX766_12805 [Pseudomonadota bacterium]|nr:hypothetical protein [Pseudomonadota bacterium]